MAQVCQDGRQTCNCELCRLAVAPLGCPSWSKRRLGAGACVAVLAQVCQDGGQTCNCEPCHVAVAPLGCPLWSKQQLGARVRMAGRFATASLTTSPWPRLAAPRGGQPAQSGSLPSLARFGPRRGLDAGVAQRSTDLANLFAASRCVTRGIRTPRLCDGTAKYQLNTS